MRHFTVSDKSLVGEFDLLSGNGTSARQNYPKELLPHERIYGEGSDAYYTESPLGMRKFWRSPETARRHLTLNPTHNLAFAYIAGKRLPASAGGWHALRKVGRE